MTLKGLIRGAVVGLLLVPLGFADDEPRGASPASSNTSGSVEALKQARVRLGGFSLTGGYSRYSGPPYNWGWGPPFYGYYDSPYWTPFWQSYFPYGGAALSSFYPAYAFQHGPNMGEIKLQAEPATASVFINDAYAGKVQDLRSISLEPGVYKLRIETEGGPSFARRIYVLSGKTLKIEADLPATKGGQRP